MKTMVCWSLFPFALMLTSACSDSSGETSSAPVAIADSGSVSVGGAVSIDVVANDTDADNDLDTQSIEIGTPPSDGTLTVNASGTIVYIHNAGDAKSDSFTYQVADYKGNLSEFATVAISVTDAINEAPIAVDDAVSVDEGALVNIDLLANDTDDSEIALSSVVIVDAPTNGTLLTKADGTVDYTHDGSETTSDSFVYTMADLAGLVSGTATVSIAVVAVNDLPIANDDSFSIAAVGVEELDLAVNDTDVDSELDLDSIVVETQPTQGSVVVNGNGTVGYTYTGNAAADSFTYTIKDVSGGISAPATVSITVQVTGVEALVVGDLVITEIMNDPTTSDLMAEWFELYNTTDSAIDLSGLVVSDAGSDSFTVAGTVVVAAKSQVLFARSGNSSVNGGLPSVDYEYGEAMSLANPTDEIILDNGIGTVIDIVPYDEAFSLTEGASKQLSRGTEDLDNSVSQNWCSGATPYGVGELGTPGTENIICE